MSKVVLYIATSLDGFVAGENDDISWLFQFNDVDYGYDAFFSRIGAIVEGRRAYDLEIKHGWEHAHPVSTFVLSHSQPERKPLRSDIVFTDDDIADVLRRAKQVSDKDVWIEGGANVAQQFIKRRMVDEIVLSIAPVLLGRGISLFGDAGEQLNLSLGEVRRFDKGLVQLCYDFQSR
ncbi:dihydrofolate reductase family protein [Mesorhizobium escarrei]|uniref:Dihydrofolate reductase n=1 Tax=Mesorhizobium escarrei TaxID=666018 RepID=A0ABM9E770_9HYPH|nr:dihydrofolate reductase family protein [Mesorhizobium escarrei]CAH2404615.1 Dihydrofolate reductase [Mesorhizobium escarrei]